MPTTNDYLLAIHHISKNKGAARTTDIAKVLNIKSPSVTGKLELLFSQGFIQYKKYEGARLSKKGDEKVKTLTARAQIFKKFLKRIDVPAHLVEKDAQTLEKGLSPQSMRQMAKFVRFVDLFGEIPCFFAHFKNFCQNGQLYKNLKYCHLPKSSPKGGKMHALAQSQYAVSKPKSKS